MDGITQERPSEGPYLNVNKTHRRQYLSTMLGTHVTKSMVFKTLRE